MFKTVHNTFMGVIPFLVLFVCFSCSDDGGAPSNADIRMEDGLLTDFPFLEVDYVAIKIIQPEITDNKETKRGSITITIPHTHSSLTLSLKSVSIDLNTFNVFPSLGTAMLFSETQPVTYEITSRENFDLVLHYDVFVVKEPSPVDELELTGFTFEKDKNPGLTQDIDTFKTADFLNEKYLFFIFPDKVDFTNLAPTISFKGQSVQYRKDGEPFSDYPENGMAIDFSYPTKVDFRINSSLGGTSEEYRIFVDIAHPIKLTSDELTLPDITIGEVYSAFGLMTWVNEGNNKITSITAATYTDLFPASADFTRVFLQNRTELYTYPGETGSINVSVSRLPDLTIEY